MSHDGLQDPRSRKKGSLGKGRVPPQSAALATICRTQPPLVERSRLEQVGAVVAT